MTVHATFRYIKDHFKDFSIKQYFRILGYAQEDRVHDENRFKEDIQKAASDNEESNLKSWAE